MNIKNVLIRTSPQIRTITDNLFEKNYVFINNLKVKCCYLFSYNFKFNSKLFNFFNFFKKFTNFYCVNFSRCFISYCNFIVSWDTLSICLLDKIILKLFSINDFNISFCLSNNLITCLPLYDTI